MPHVSQRGNMVPLSPFRKLSHLAEQAKSRGKKVYHLNIGQPDILTPPYALHKLKESDISILAYSPAEGWSSTRQAVAHYYSRYGLTLQEEQVIITTGASEALQLSLMACLEKGEEFIMPEPFYANYNGFAHIADVSVKPITCHIEDGFALPSIAEFEAAIGPKTRAIMICNPNNPTGCFYPKETLEALAELVKKYDLFLMVDEVYRDFCYDDQTFFSALKLEGIREHVIVFDSVSKRYSACGARVGALISYNEEVLAAVSRYAKLRLSPPALGQMVAEWMMEDDEAYLTQVKDEYLQRRNIVADALASMKGVTSYTPGGAFYCFARFPIDDADEFCQWLLEEFDYHGATVMLSPGAGFYATPGLGKTEVRLAYVLNTKDLKQAMICLEQALLTYPGRTRTSAELVDSQTAAVAD